MADENTSWLNPATLRAARVAHLKTLNEEQLSGALRGLERLNDLHPGSGGIEETLELTRAEIESRRPR